MPIWYRSSVSQHLRIETTLNVRSFHCSLLRERQEIELVRDVQLHRFYQPQTELYISLQPINLHRVLLICKAVGKSHPYESTHHKGNLFFHFLHLLPDILLRMKNVLAFRLAHLLQEEVGTQCDSWGQPEALSTSGEPLGSHAGSAFHG